MKELTVLRLRNMMKDNPGGVVAGKTGLMGSFGENLRREREMRGVTLEEISAATKISIRFLKSIENEEFARLPGGIFSRSFVRAYARYLGLDEDPLIEEYQQAARARTDIDLSHFTPPRANSRPERHSWHGLWAVAIAAGLLVLGLILWRHSHRPLQAPAVANVARASAPATKTPAGPTGAATANTTPPTAKVPAQGGVLAATPSVAAAPQLPPVTSTDGKLVLQIAATERSWVAIDVDGNSVMQGVMDPNTVKTFKADASFDVLTGNAQGVILTLNGQTMKPLGREGEVKQVHLTWDSLKKQNSD
ncbi:MAG TPA: RodZ domain-containing protein [Terriglobia bacterium]|nr:RodZ domain-containing protein [Terriglobia bacterium]